MRRIKEVLRLKEGLGLSDTAVSRSVRIARSTVKEYLDRAAAVGLNWEAVAELSEEELDRRLFAAVDTRHWDRPLPDWEAVEKELRGRGVTLRLLWLEYLSRHPEGYRYTQFCAHFHAWQRHSRPPTMRRQHRAGEALEVDYAGMTLSVIDKDVVRQAQVFVACLPCSDLTYAEASWTQGHEDWLGAHVRAFAYIGGCPKKVIPDNLKTGVTDANYWDPVLNRSYHALGPGGRRIEVPPQSFYVATLVTSDVVTVIGGQEVTRHTGDSWSVPSGASMVVQLQGRSEGALLDIFRVEPNPPAR